MGLEENSVPCTSQAHLTISNHNFATKIFSLFPSHCLFPFSVALFIAHSVSVRDLENKATTMTVITGIVSPNSCLNKIN